MLRERHSAMQRWIVQPIVRVLTAVRTLLRLTGVMAVVCGCASTKPAKDASEEPSDDDTGEPEACRPTAGKAIAAALGGFSQGVNGGGNQPLEMQQERCRQARDAQRFNADHRARVILARRRAREWDAHVFVRVAGVASKKAPIETCRCIDGARVQKRARIGRKSPTTRQPIERPPRARRRRRGRPVVDAAADANASDAADAAGE
jgi:hypothetical protein